jgi:hypothetical protein
VIEAIVRHGRRKCGLAALGALAILLLVSPAPTSLAAQGPHEPNDIILNAAGPLTAGQPLVAGLETQVDRDFFFFYVTSPGNSQVLLTVTNLGGGSEASNLAATIMDSSATPVGGLSYVSSGEAKTATLTLRPQKYFVEVAPNEGFGDTYSLTGSGSDGAFGPYERIAARCARASAAVARARVRLTRAQAKQQRVTARVRRSRYAARGERRAARRAYRRARARVGARRRALRATRASRRPWCQIPR